MRNDSADAYIKQTASYLRVEVPMGDDTQVEEIYRSLAVVCIQRQITRVLVKVAQDDHGGERALRDAFKAILLAGIALDFRIALIAATQRVEAAYRNAQRELSLANVNVQIFDSEGAAVQWLDASGARVAVA